MASLSRRGFLGGLLASAAVAPVVHALPAVAPLADSIFSGSIGIYNGVIIREVLTIDHVLKAKAAMMRAPKVQPLPNGCYAFVITPRWADALLTPSDRHAYRAQGVHLVPEQRIAA